MVQTKDFDFNLPEELIAQTPLEDRSSSRLMVIDRQDPSITHGHFRSVIDYLEPGDALVLNETRVLPARLFGQKPETGGHLEVLLLHQKEEDTWECLVKPARRAKKGTQIVFGDQEELRAEVIEELPQGGRVLSFQYEGIFLEVLERLGQMPLPPYIKETLDDSERYQTVYAKEEGSAAAPTAGLHFTPELLEAIQAKGVHVVPLVLHVGLGTFRPVSVDRVEDHQMHAEYYQLSEASAATLNQVRQAGGAIVAVGTTSVRTLESVAANNQGQLVAESGWTDIFIRPGYEFQAVDHLITNFHLPQSTLLMLVSAFSDRALMMEAYRTAVDKEYRFFSFGDAMLIL